MIIAKLFVDGMKQDTQAFDDDLCHASVLAKAAIHFGVTSENAIIHNIGDREIIATRNNMPVCVMLEQGMPFTDIIAQTNLWRDLYAIHTKRNQVRTV